MTFWHGPSSSPDCPNGSSRAEGTLTFSDLSATPLPLGEVRVPKNGAACVTIEATFFATDGTTRKAAFVYTTHLATRGAGDVDPSGAGTVTAGLVDSTFGDVEGQTESCSFVFEHLADRVTFAFDYQLSDVGALAGRLRYVIRDLFGNEVTGRER